MKIAVLGAGMVGSAMAIDLSRQHEVTAFDRSAAVLERLAARCPALTVQQADLQDYAGYTMLLAPFDYVVQALPGFMGYAALEAVIKAGRSVVDISFFPEAAGPLHQLAVDHGVTVVTDCGVAPGMSNFILGRCAAEMEVTRFEAVVGGLPQERTLPFEYKAPFSPVDVLEEYTRPARFRENGVDITRPALSDVELMDMAGIGTLEAFNTDGLRSLLHSFPQIPTLKEKTLRYPGHAALIGALLKAGLLSDKPVGFDGKMISPLAFNGALLMDQWRLGPEEPELTVMRVICSGRQEDRPVRVQWDLLDRYDAVTRTSSMARTTGYTCTAVVQLGCEGKLPGPGLFYPEQLGADAALFEHLMNYLKERGVIWRRQSTGE